MTRMLDDLLDASRIALGKVSIEIERVGLTELLTEVLDEQQARAQQAGLRIIAQFTRSRLASSKRTAFGSNRSSTTSCRTPSSSLLRAEQYGFRSYRRKGTQLSRSETPEWDLMITSRVNCLTRYASGAGARSTRGGLGLGLAIASRLAKLQGAVLSAASAGINKGAMFTLRIPLTHSSDEV